MNNLILILSGVIAIICLISTVIAILSIKTVVNGTKSELRTGIDKNSLALEANKAVIEAVRSEVGRLKFENYDNLRQKHDVIISDIHDTKARVDALDSSIKNFYSRWAKKLGQISKNDDAANLDSDSHQTQQEIEQMTQAAQAQNHRPLRQGSFHKLRGR